MYLWIYCPLVSAYVYFFSVMSVSPTISVRCGEDIDRFHQEATRHPSLDEEAKNDRFINHGDPEENIDSKANLCTQYI